MSTHVLYGDSFLVAQEVRRLESQSGASELLEANRHRLQGDLVKLQELLGICNTLPFMDVRRLVVVEGLLAAFDGLRAGSGRSSGRARTRDRNPRRLASPPAPLSIPSTAPRTGSDGEGEAKRGVRLLGGWEALAQALPGIPETALLVFMDGPLQANNPLLRSLSPVAQVRALTTPVGEALARWIKTAAEKKGASVSPAAIKLLADLVGNDLWTLDQELEKLALYATGRRIEEADVKELVPLVREANIFNAVDAMLEARPGVALRLLHQLRQDGRELSYLISMVGRQLRLVALARELSEQGLSQREIGSRLRLASQFVLRKTLGQARKHSWDAITWRYQRLLEADLAVKRGLMEEDLALELMAAEMAGQR